MNELIGPIAKLEGQSRTLKQTEGEAVDLTHQLIVIEREYERVEAERDAALEAAAGLEEECLRWMGDPAALARRDGRPENCLPTPGYHDRRQMEEAGVVEVVEPRWEGSE